jgi:antitoxin component YwqK of YwqJK toxin-antitoxin module
MSSRSVVPACAGLIALFLLACSAPAPRPKEELLRQGSLYLDPATLEPYSGAIFTTFEGAPDRVVQRASLREGHYDGPLEWYSGEGQLELRELYRDGTKEGPYEWYFESGQVYERGFYIDGRREGPYEAYYESGELYERGSYRAGAFDGPREWFQDNRLIERVTYADGRVDGPYERYGEDGAIELSGTLRDGIPCGIWLEHGATVTHESCEDES